MQKNKWTIQLSQLYLIMVPLLTIALALGVGYISYKIYLPVWLVNIALMAASVYTLANGAWSASDAVKKRLFAVAICFIIPTMLTSLFFGLGAPPYESPVMWVQTITEQRLRYYFLLASGFFIAIGFGLLSQQLKTAGENFYSIIGSIAIQIAMPVFLLDMSFWGFYLSRFYKQLVAAHTDTIPDWVIPLRTQFYYVNVLVCALIYLAMVAFAISLAKTGWLKAVAVRIWVFTSGLFFIFAVLPPGLSGPFDVLNFIVTIPAVPFMFPYFMGICLLRKLGRNAS